MLVVNLRWECRSQAAGAGHGVTSEQQAQPLLRVRRYYIIVCGDKFCGNFLRSHIAKITDSWDNVTLMITLYYEDPEDLLIALDRLG